jgi:hypothetical protein
MVKKKEKQKTEQAEKKSRAKYQCPPDLGKLIEVYNLVTVDTVLKTEEELISEAVQAALQYDDRYGACEYETHQFLKNAAIDFFENHPKLNEHIKTKGLFGYFNSEIDMYVQFEYFRKNLDELVALGIMWNRSRLSHTLQSDELITFKVSNSGKWEYFSSGTIAKMIAEALKDAYVDRLRRCKICNHIFWAKREESETCSAPCFGILRTRRYRELTVEEKAERKAQREANRERNKKLKEIRSKNNGTL